MLLVLLSLGSLFHCAPADEKAVSANAVITTNTTQNIVAENWVVNRR